MFGLFIKWSMPPCLLTLCAPATRPSFSGFLFSPPRQQRVSCLNSWPVFHRWLWPIVGQLESFIGLPSFTQSQWPRYRCTLIVAHVDVVAPRVMVLLWAPLSPYDFHGEHGNGGGGGGREERGGGMGGGLEVAEFGCSRARNQPHLASVDRPDKEQKTKGGILLRLHRRALERFHVFLLFRHSLSSEYAK